MSTQQDSASKKVLKKQLENIGALPPRVAGEIVEAISKLYIIRLDPINHPIEAELPVAKQKEAVVPPRSEQPIAPGATTSDSIGSHDPDLSHDAEHNDGDQSQAEADYDTDTTTGEEISEGQDNEEV